MRSTLKPSNRQRSVVVGTRLAGPVGQRPDNSPAGAGRFGPRRHAIHLRDHSRAESRREKRSRLPFSDAVSVWAGPTARRISGIRRDIGPVVRHAAPPGRAGIAGRENCPDGGGRAGGASDSAMRTSPDDDFFNPAVISSAGRTIAPTRNGDASPNPSPTSACSSRDEGIETV